MSIYFQNLVERKVSCFNSLINSALSFVIQASRTMTDKFDRLLLFPIQVLIMIKLMLMISAYPLTISSYKKTIRKKSWFDGLQLKFNSVDFPHTKTIPYEKNVWPVLQTNRETCEDGGDHPIRSAKRCRVRSHLDQCAKKGYVPLIKTPVVKAYNKHELFISLEHSGSSFLCMGSSLPLILTLITNLFNL